MSELAEEKRLASIKQAEVLSVVGAGVLGAGLALLAPAALGPYVYWLIGVGVAVHGLGMTMTTTSGTHREAFVLGQK